MSFVRLTIVTSDTFAEFDESFDDDTNLPDAMAAVYRLAREELDLPGGAA